MLTAFRTSACHGWHVCRRSSVYLPPVRAGSIFLAIAAGFAGRKVCCRAEEEFQFSGEQSERRYQWQFSASRKDSEACADSRIGNFIASLSSSSLDAVWSLLAPGDQLEINKYMEELDHLGQQIQRSPNSETLRKLYVKKTRACAEILLPRIHGMLQNETDSKGRKLSEQHKDKLRILKCKLQSSLHSISFESVRGHAALKQDLEECVVWPCLNSSLFKEIRRPPRGILLYGPPGNGKTMIAKALAAKVGVPFYQISSSDVVSRYHGDSEKNLRALCEAARAEPHGAVVFIDEIDSLAPSRDGFGIHSFDVKQINELLHQIDGIKLDDDYDKVIYIGATNRPWSLDPALLRRLPKKCYLGPPDNERRQDFIDYAIMNNTAVSFELSSEEAMDFVKETHGYSYSALDSLIREACMQPVREVVQDGTPISQVDPGQVPPVRLHHLKQAASRITADVDISSLKRFESWNVSNPTQKADQREATIGTDRPFLTSARAASVAAIKTLEQDDLVIECARMHAENASLMAELSALQASHCWVDATKAEAMRFIPLMALTWFISKLLNS